MPICFHFKKYLKKTCAGDPAKLLYNYIHHSYPDDNQEFNFHIIKSFFLWVLHDSHYRNIQSSLTHFVFDEIQPYFRENHMGSEFIKLQSLLPFQVIHIEQESDILSALNSWYKKTSTSHDSFYVVPMRNSKKFLVLNLKIDGRLEVFVHSSTFVIDEGILRPLAPLTELYYNSQFELDPLQVHKIDSSPDIFFQIYIRHSQRIDLQKLTFPEMTEIQVTPLTQLKDHDELFNYIKMLENHYIQPKSDPAYKELIQSMQNCYHALITQQPHAVSQATKILKKAQSALQLFYTNDRLLLLLFANIEYRLKIKADSVSKLFIGKTQDNVQDPFIQNVIHTQTSK